MDIEPSSGGGGVPAGVLAQVCHGGLGVDRNVGGITSQVYKRQDAKLRAIVSGTFIAKIYKVRRCI